MQIQFAVGAESFAWRIIWYVNIGNRVITLAYIILYDPYWCSLTIQVTTILIINH